jgi:Tfp pilus assembly protein PilZ
MLAQALSSYNILYTFAIDIRDLKDNLYEHPCNGILFSIASLMGLDLAGKTFIQALEQVFPVARIRLNQTKGTFALISSRSGRVETIADFLDICADFPARRLRKSDRLSTTLNALVSRSPDLAEAEQTFTTNISLRGSFIHTVREWSAGDAAFVQFQELPSKSIIKAKIVRYVPWGMPFRVQGIGIQFMDLAKEQERELKEIISVESD